MSGKNIYFQPNSKDIKDEYGDCAVRAICKAENKSWVEIFDSLCVIARELQAMPSSKVTCETFFKKNGYTYQGISNKKGSKRPTVAQFSKNNKKGTFILVVANHYVCAQDGNYFDIWDCGEKSMYGYWEKQ